MAPFVAAAVSWFAIDWDETGSEDYPAGTVLRDSRGGILRVTLGKGGADCRPYYRADREDWIVKALVAAEDGGFYSHHGVEPLAMARAFAQNVFRGRRVSGASTISMQTVRLIRPHRKTYAAKWVEAFEAMKMERKRSKDWILTAYLNRAPFGASFVGIEAAANGWFGKNPKDLDIGEAALLAGMVQAPSRYRPDRGYPKALKRREYVLGRMLKLGMITEDQMEGALTVKPELAGSARAFRAPHYCDYVLRASGIVQRGGGDYTTPLEPDIQDMVEGLVNTAAKAEGYSVAAIVMKVESGDVVALTSSGDYLLDEGAQVNTALSPRPAGSTLKPLLAALALDRGIITRETMLPDRPKSFSGYRPVNFDGKYRGEVSLHDALVLSLNLPFVDLANRVGVDTFADTLAEYGFARAKAPGSAYGLGLAIGNCDVTLLELVTAYRKFALAAASENSVRNTEGTDPVSPESAWAVSEMLAGEERASAATGHIAAVKLPQFAWKTGTSSAYRDAWTIAWNPEYVIGVWCGHLSGGFGDTRLVGAKAAAPLAWKLARRLYPGGDCPRFPGGACPRETGTDPFGIVQSAECGVQSARGRENSVLGEKMAMLCPVDGEEFTIVAGGPKERIVCRATGGAGAKRWWFVDGVMMEAVDGDRPFVWEPLAGEHRIVCTDSDGNSAESRIVVSRK